MAIQKILKCPKNCYNNDPDDTSFYGNEIQSLSITVSAFGDWIDSGDSDWISGPDDYYCCSCGEKAYWEETFIPDPVKVEGEPVYLSDLTPAELPYNTPFDVI